MSARFYLLAGLGLLLLTLGMFAVVSPFNGAAFDDWGHHYVGEQRAFGNLLNGRDYAHAGIIWAWMALPYRGQSIFVAHLVYVFGASLGIFHLVYRLGGRKAWLAFALAAAHIVYIPYNFEQVRPLYIIPPSWTVFLLVMIFCLLLAYDELKSAWRWPIWGLSVLLGYVGTRTYEASIPMLLIFPLLIWLLRRVPRSALWYASMGVWELGIGWGIWRSLEALQGSNAASLSLGERLQNWLASLRALYANSFPLEPILKTPADLLLPSLILGLLAGLLMWRLLQDSEALSWQKIGGLILLGLALIGVGGGAFIFAGFVETPRAYFFSQLGQVMVIWGGWNALARLLDWGLKLPWRASVVAGMVLLVFLGGQWYYQAQIWAQNVQSPPAWDEKNYFWREVLAQVPNLKADSLLLFHCPNPALPAFYGRMIDVHAGRMLYPQTDFAMTWYQYVLYNRQTLIFEADSIRYEYASDMLNPARGLLAYDFSEVVALACWGDEVILLDRLPADLLLGGGESYNPYARFERAFIPPDLAQFLAR